jgi:hypothetical protein
MNTTAPAGPITLAAPGDPGVPLLLAAHRRAGFRTAGRGLAMLVAWEIAERSLGHQLGEGAGITAALEEYRAYWRQTERTSWNELSACRAAFGWDHPGELVAAVLDQRQARAPGRRVDFAGVAVA